jgi:Na+/proline symporter
VLAHILGAGGAFILLLQLFMAITSTGSAEIIAVSSILTYDVYYEYINPELKSRREALRAIFYKVVAGFEQEGKVPVSQLPALLSALVNGKFFEKTVSTEEAAELSACIQSFSVDGLIPTADLYNAVNKVVSSNSIEGIILLRVSKFFTAVFAIFMGFLAVFLQTLGFSLGWVYMSMGVIIGSAVGPASLTILMETANGLFIGAGAIGGLILGVLGWTIKASVDNGGVVSYDTLGQDWPWVVGNLCAILGGLFIAGVGSLVFPDKEFRWHMLNERIPRVDDVEPPKDQDESEEKLQWQVKVAVIASVVLTLVLLVLWPLPMHAATGVFGKGGFTVWVALEMIWSLLGGIVIIGLPLYETFQSFRQAKAAMEQTKASSKDANSILGADGCIKVEDAPAPAPEKPSEVQASC